jgi:uncharacterized protein YndB with AHSA1/START domain
MTDARPQGIADTDVYMSRAFNAPRDLVWRFWTEPELVSTWFGPHTTHTPVDKIEIDLQPGGAWNITMVDNETGEEYPIRGRVVEVEQPVYFLVELNGETEKGFAPTMQLRVEFHDHGDKTRVTLHEGPFTAEFRDLTIEGWEESFVKMDGEFA